MSAAAAARQAGYSAKYADRQASKLVEKSLVRTYLLELTAELAKPEIATAQERQTWWSRIMRTERIPWRWRLRASELLGRAQADFTERRIDIPAEAFERMTDHQLDRLRAGEDPLRLLWEMMADLSSSTDGNPGNPPANESS